MESNFSLYRIVAKQILDSWSWRAIGLNQYFFQGFWWLFAGSNDGKINLMPWMRGIRSTAIHLDFIVEARASVFFSSNQRNKLLGVVCAGNELMDAHDLFLYSLTRLSGHTYSDVKNHWWTLSIFMSTWSYCSISIQCLSFKAMCGLWILSSLSELGLLP